MLSTSVRHLHLSAYVKNWRAWARLEFEGRPLERVEQMAAGTAAIKNSGNTWTGETP